MLVLILFVYKHDKQYTKCIEHLFISLLPRWPCKVLFFLGFLFPGVNWVSFLAVRSLKSTGLSCHVWSFWRKPQCIRTNDPFMYIVLQITLCLLQRTTACKLHYLQTYQQLWARLFVEKTLLRFTFYEPQFCFYNCELFSSWFDLPTPPPQKKKHKMQGKDYRTQFQFGNGALFGASYIQVCVWSSNAILLRFAWITYIFTWRNRILLTCLWLMMSIVFYWLGDCRALDTSFAYIFFYFVDKISIGNLELFNTART